jgi:WD40 repeat protein
VGERLEAQCPRCLLNLAIGFDEPGVAMDGLLDATQVRSFGDYELLEEIARGGMGVVYRARQLSLHREVAVKMILAGELATTESVQRFRNEAATAARLDHPNIVSVYEIGEHEMQHFFSMRLVLGRRNIATWAKSLASPAAERIAAMMAKIARTVMFAHERGVLHRDLKPSNILVDEKNEPQVTDFGLAKLVHEENSGLTLSAAILGSPSYMAPEQADGRHRDVTTVTDVYGLGAVLYELLAGRPPFVGASPFATARLVVEQMPGPLPNTPRDLATICLKCLAKEPAQRYPSARTLAEDLERFASGESIRARPVSAPEAMWRWARRKPALAALIASTVLAFLVGFTGVFWQWRRAEHANTGLRASIAQLEWRRTVQLLDAGDNSVGLAQLARLLRGDPANPRAASLAVSVLEQGGFAVPAAPELSHGRDSIITEARLSADETRIVTAGSDGTARLWEAATSRPLGAPMQHGGPVRWVEFSPDDRSVATASDDGTARVWDAQTGAPISAPLRHDGPVTMVKFGPAPLLATIGADGAARVWREGGEALQLPLGGPGRALAWSRDGRRLFTASDAGLKGWDLEGRELFSHDGAVQGLALSPDGTRLAGWAAKSVWLWDAATGAESAVKLEGAAGLLDAAWSPDGTRLAGASHAGWARVWDATGGRAITPRLNHLYGCSCVTFSPDGHQLLSGGDEGVARRWNPATGAPVGALINHHEAVMGAAFSARGDRLLLVAHPWNDRSKPRGGTAQLWDLQHRGPLPWRYRPAGATSSTSSVAWSPDGSLWATNMVGGEVTLHAEGQPPVTLPASKKEGWARGLTFLPDGRYLLVVSTVGEVSVWSIETRQRTLGPLNIGPVEGVCLLPDGGRAVIGMLSGEVAVWDLARGVIVSHLPTHRAPINCVDVSPDGRFVASAGEDGQCIVSDVATGQSLFPAIQADDEFVSVQFSHDGRWIVTASHDRTARMWDARTGVARGPALRHDGEVAYAEFSPDDARVLTADRAGAARLWSAATGEPLTDSMRHTTALRHARFSPDGRRIVTEDHTGLRFWETATGEPLAVLQPHPTSIGIGFFSHGMHVAFSPDGQSVLHGTATADALRWDFPAPPVPAPEWLPELLEAVASLSVTDGNALAVVPSTRWLALRDRLRDLPGEDFYSRWARRYCREAGK